MLGRALLSFFIYILMVTFYKEQTIALGNLLGLTGFFAIFVPAAATALSIYRLLDTENWSVIDAVALLWIAASLLLLLSNDPRAALYELTKSIVGFSVAALLGALAMKSKK